MPDLRESSAGEEMRKKRPEVRATNAKELGAMIRAARGAVGLSITEVGHKIGASAAHISRIELGKGGPPTLRTLNRLGRVLGVRWMLSLEKEPS